MIKVAICNDNSFSRKQDETIIRCYLPEFELSSFDDSQQLFDSGQYDAYILSINENNISSIISFGLELYTRENNAIILYISDNIQYFLNVFGSHPFDCITRPDYKEKLLSLKQKLFTVFGIKTTEGIQKVFDKEILYANKQGRIAQYHLNNGEILTTHSLRNSFEQSVKDILNNNNFLLLGTSLVVNLTHIKTVTTESIILDSGEEIYPPRGFSKQLPHHLPWLRRDY